MIGSGLPSPTVAQARRMDLIGEAGCICCWSFAELATPAEVHHLTIGEHHGAPRRGHEFTLGLCAWHHRGRRPLSCGAQPSPTRARMVDLVGPSYAETPNEFRRVFGGDDVLLQLQSRQLLVLVATYLIHPGRYADPVAPGGFRP